MGDLVWRLSMMTLWTGFKQLHSTSDHKIVPNEELLPHVRIGHLLKCGRLLWTAPYEIPLKSLLG